MQHRKSINFIKLKSNIGLHTCLCIHGAVYYFCIVWFEIRFQIDLKLHSKVVWKIEKAFISPPLLLACWPSSAGPVPPAQLCSRSASPARPALLFLPCDPASAGPVLLGLQPATRRGAISSLVSLTAQPHMSAAPSSSSARDWDGLRRCRRCRIRLCYAAFDVNPK